MCDASSLAADLLTFDIQFLCKRETQRVAALRLTGHVTHLVCDTVTLIEVT